MPLPYSPQYVPLTAAQQAYYNQFIAAPRPTYRPIYRWQPYSAPQRTSISGFQPPARPAPRTSISGFNYPQAPAPRASISGF